MSILLHYIFYPVIVKTKFLNLLNHEKNLSPQNPFSMVYIFIYFSLILFTNKGFSQCLNADLSMGDFSHWAGSTGDNNYGITAGRLQLI